MTLAGATFSATDVNVTYVAASGNTPTSSASPALPRSISPTGPDLSLTLGSAAQPGLVFSGGASRA